MAVNSTPESAAADQVVPGSSGRVLADAEVAERVDALMAEMTISEKAGQLTQYFYFDLPPSEEIEATLHADFSRQPAMVEAALSEGKVGSLLFVTDPAEVNRLQRLAVDGNRQGIPALFGFDVIHGLHDHARADRDGRVLGPGGHRAVSGRRRSRVAGGRDPLGVRADGRHRA